MGFYRPPRHFELLGDLGVIAPLEKQLDNLLFARTQPDSLLLHHFPHFPYSLHHLRLDSAHGGIFPKLIAPAMPI